MYVNHKYKEIEVSVTDDAIMMLIVVRQDENLTYPGLEVDTSFA